MSDEAPRPATVRAVSGAEARERAHPLMDYAFGAGPSAPRPAEDAGQDEEKAADPEPTTLLAEVDGAPVATAVGWPFEQNVRGLPVTALGVGGVAAHPDHRRGGHVRSVLNRLHADAIAAGAVTAALYPFRPSFYARFGYAGLPQPRHVRLLSPGLEELLRLDLPVTVTLARSGDAGCHEACRAVDDRWFTGRHGFIRDTLPGPADSVRERDDRYVALARRADGTPVGYLRFRTEGFAKIVKGDWLLADDAVTRTALLKWLAAHHDQFAGFEFRLPPGEFPETWFTDAQIEDLTKARIPDATAPMARVLNLPGLAGMHVGETRVRVEVTGVSGIDGDVDGVYVLDGAGGELAVRPGGGHVTEPTAALSVRALSALVFGGTAPAQLEALGQAVFPGDTADHLARLFPPALPFLHRAF